jgi:hypothetical protein
MCFSVEISQTTVMRVNLRRSPKPEKKWRVTLPGGKSVDFGSRGMSDYTIHKDANRMKLYVRRHGGVMPRGVRSTREKWDNPMTPGFWSRWLLWSRPSIAEAKTLITKKFGFKFTA